MVRKLDKYAPGYGNMIALRVWLDSLLLLSNGRGFRSHVAQESFSRVRFLNLFNFSN